MAVVGVGTGPGHVFCARVGDHPSSVFRFVGRGEPGVDVVVDETLTCLHRARPPEGFANPRVLDDADAHDTFDASEVARADIVEKWNFMSDKANLEPRIPPRLARAASVVREHPAAGMTQDEIDRNIDTIQAPYPERTIRTFQAALNSSEDPAQQAEAIVRVIRDLGLQPFVPPEPLPEITPDDVYCVTWLALV
ncbi:hypothetical protein [Candidatus Poriferisodalis sp.]|uniref:hypothetical protein n=1 Tax=Candidatus Poriferisodalis sp. TaxID=3101277 RepID=UPI003B5B37C7